MTTIVRRGEGSWVQGEGYRKKILLRELLVYVVFKTNVVDDDLHWEQE